MQVALIRHGKTLGNTLGNYVGKTDESLCNAGIKELEFMINKNSYPKCDYLAVSPMKRCTETADLIYPNQIKQIVPDFRETNFGIFENKNYEQLKNLPEYQSWLESGGKIAFPGGESREESDIRFRTAFINVIEHAKLLNKKKLACVIHGGAIMSILEQFSRPKLDFYDYKTKNNKGFLIKLDENKWTKAPFCCIVSKIGE